MTVANDTKMTMEEVQEWLAIRKEAGLQIDPESAEVDWIFARTLDPYGVRADLPKECDQVGREYSGRSPGSDVWVWFGDLPEATRDALWEKHRKIVNQLGGNSERANPMPMPVSEEDVKEARESLTRAGLIVDSGRRRFSERTGRWEIVWVVADPGTMLQ